MRACQAGEICVIPAGAQRNAGISFPAFRAQSEDNFLTEDYLPGASNSVKRRSIQIKCDLIQIKCHFIRIKSRFDRIMYHRIRIKPDLIQIKRHLIRIRGDQIEIK